MSDREPGRRSIFERSKQLGVDAARTWLLDDEAPGVALAVRAWRVGALGRIALATLLVGVAISATLLVAHEGRPRALPPAALAVALALLLVATSLGLAAARALSLPLYVMSALAIGWYGLLPAGGVADTPLFALPPVTLFAFAWVSARVHPTRGRRWWLLPLALEVGWVSRRALGLSVPDDALDTAAGLALGVALWALATHRRALACRRFVPGTGATFVITLVAFGVPWVIGAAREPEASAERVVLLGRGLLLPLALFWLWLGATTFQGAIALGRWAVRTSARVLGDRVVTPALPIVWLVAAAFAWLATWPVPVWAAVLAHDLGFTAWAASWGDGMWFAVRWQVWASLVVLIAWLVQRVRGKHGVALASWLNALWVATFLGALGLWEAAEYAVSAAEEAAPETQWAAVMLIGGIIWEIARSSGDWSGAAPSRAIGLLSGLVAVLATLVATLGAGLPDLLVEYGFYAFLGVVVLGVPLAIAELVGDEDDEETVTQGDRPPRLGGPRLVGLGLLGAATASFVLGLDAWAGPALGLAPPLWALALWRVEARLAARDARTLMTAGATLGVGFGVFWLSPEALPIPFFDAWQSRYLELDLARPVFDLGAFLMPLLTLAIGGGLGFAISRLRGSHVALPIAVASALMAIVPPLVPDIPTGAGSVRGSAAQRERLGRPEEALVPGADEQRIAEGGRAGPERVELDERARAGRDLERADERGGGVRVDGLAG